MKKMIAPFITALMLLSFGSSFAQDRYGYEKEIKYMAQIDNQDDSPIQDFVVDIPSTKVGSVIKFVVDGQTGAAPVVKFNSSGKFYREVPLKETEPGRYTGKYVVRNVDNLDSKSYSLLFNYNKRKYTANFIPVSTYSKSEPIFSYQDQPQTKQQYQQRVNPNFGTVTSIDYKEIKSEEVDLKGAGLGALAGGVLGNQIGQGDGKTLATILGVVGGAVAGNNVANNMNKQKVWTVTARFEDGSTQSFSYNIDPQVQQGTLVRRENGNLIRR